MIQVGVAQLVGHCPMNGEVASLIPSQSTCLDCGFGPDQGNNFFSFKEAGEEF